MLQFAFLIGGLNYQETAVCGIELKAHIDSLGYVCVLIDSKKESHSIIQLKIAQGKEEARSRGEPFSVIICGSNLLTYSRQEMFGMEWFYYKFVPIVSNFNKSELKQFLGWSLYREISPSAKRFVSHDEFQSLVLNRNTLMRNLCTLYNIDPIPEIPVRISIDDTKRTSHDMMSERCEVLFLIKDEDLVRIFKSQKKQSVDEIFLQTMEERGYAKYFTPECRAKKSADEDLNEISTFVDRISQILQCKVYEPDKLYSELLCDSVFTLDIMDEPVIAADGFTYEKRCITEWLKKTRRSPSTGAALSSTALIPNRSLEDHIRRWRESEKVGSAVAVSDGDVACADVANVADADVDDADVDDADVAGAVAGGESAVVAGGESAVVAGGRVARSSDDEFTS
jgi:hypothetical protein